MGTWGTAISSNDTYADIYSQFFDLYNDGLDVKRITDDLIILHRDTIDDLEDANNFWFALARAQWECKQLDTKIFEKIKNIIETGADIEVWRLLAAEEKDIKKRKIVLDKFLFDLSKKRQKAKPRKKKKILQPVFEKGDCITFQFINGNYGGAVILEAIYNTEYGYNLIAALRINQQTKPIVKDFETSQIVVLTFASWENIPNIFWYYPIRHTLISNKFEIVGKIEVTEIYSIKEADYYHAANLDISLIVVLQRQFEFEETNPKSSTSINIKNVTKKNKWKFW